MVKKATIKMSVEINEQKYPLYVGFGFLSEVEKLATNDFGGLEMALIGLIEREPFTVKKVLEACLVTHEDVSEKDIEKYIETEMDMETFCKDFLELLASANLTKAKYKKMMPILQRLTKAMEKQLKQIPERMETEIEKMMFQDSTTTE